MNILIVDDEPELAEVILFHMEDAGFHATVAPDSETALKMIKSSEPIDVILSDVRMPAVSGIDLLTAAKEFRSPSIRVILITGFSDVPIEDALALGAEYVVKKPIEFDELIKIVQEGAS